MEPNEIILLVLVVIGIIFIVVSFVLSGREKDIEGDKEIQKNKQRLLDEMNEVYDSYARAAQKRVEKAAQEALKASVKDANREIEVLLNETKEYLELLSEGARSQMEAFIEQTQEETAGITGDAKRDMEAMVALYGEKTEAHCQGVVAEMNRHRDEVSALYIQMKEMEHALEGSKDDAVYDAEREALTASLIAQVKDGVMQQLTADHVLINEKLLKRELLAASRLQQEKRTQAAKEAQQRNSARSKRNGAVEKGAEAQKNRPAEVKKGVAASTEKENEDVNTLTEHGRESVNAAIEKTETDIRVLTGREKEKTGVPTKEAKEEKEDAGKLPENAAAESGVLAESAMENTGLWKKGEAFVVQETELTETSGQPTEKAVSVQNADAQKPEPSETADAQTTGDVTPEASAEVPLKQQESQQQEASAERPEETAEEGAQAAAVQQETPETSTRPQAVSEASDASMQQEAIAEVPEAFEAAAVSEAADSAKETIKEVSAGPAAPSKKKKKKKKKTKKTGMQGAEKENLEMTKSFDRDKIKDALQAAKRAVMPEPVEKEANEEPEPQESAAAEEFDIDSVVVADVEEFDSIATETVRAAMRALDAKEFGKIEETADEEEAMPESAYVPEEEDDEIPEDMLVEDEPNMLLHVVRNSGTVSTDADMDMRRKVLKMYDQGRSTMEIASMTQLGIGEVRMIIDLYSRRER